MVRKYFIPSGVFCARKWWEIYIIYPKSNNHRLQMFRHCFDIYKTRIITSAKLISYSSCQCHCTGWQHLGTDFIWWPTNVAPLGTDTPSCHNNVIIFWPLYLHLVVGNLKTHSFAKWVISHSSCHQIFRHRMPNESSCSLVSKNGPGYWFWPNIDWVMALRRKET